MVGLAVFTLMGSLAFADQPLALSVSPATVPVESYTTVSLEVTVGTEPLVKGDTLLLFEPTFHGVRWWWSGISDDDGDCAVGEDPIGLVTLSTDSLTGTVSLTRHLDTNVLHDEGVTLVHVEDGYLTIGETVTLTIGDMRDFPDCGFTVGPRAFQNVAWRGAVLKPGKSAIDWFDADALMDITAHPTVSTALLTTASQAALGEFLPVRLALLDANGNPVPDYTGTVRLSSDLDATFLASTHTFSAEDGGVWQTLVRPDALGVLRLRATDAAGRGVVESNPVVVEQTLHVPGVFWGDIHVHHGNSYEGDDGQRVDQNHDYARDVMGLQVGSESVKAGELELDADDLWAHQQEICETYTVDGEYVALLGFEWMGAAIDGEGHHNVYYDGCDGPLGASTMPGLADPTDGLFVFQAEVQADLGLQSVAIPHASTRTGFNWADQDDTLRPLAEIYSQGWGFSDSIASDGSAVYDAVGLGLRLGFMAASDNHVGWMGNNLAPNGRNQNSGLTAYVATDLSRAGVFEAMASRSTYATTGQRSVLRFWAFDHGVVQMGEEVVADSPTFMWSYAPASRIASVDLLAMHIDPDGGYGIERLEQWTPVGRDADGSHTLAWDGTPAAVWLHVVEASGHEAWSSPIWLTDDCDAPGAADPGGLCG